MPHQPVRDFQQQVDVDQVCRVYAWQRSRGTELLHYDGPLFVQRQGPEGIEGNIL